MGCGESGVCKYVSPGKQCGPGAIGSCSSFGSDYACWCGHCIPEECTGDLSRVILDYQLEEKIRYAASKPDGVLRYEHVWNIEVAPFDANPSDLEEFVILLDGLQCLTALEELDLSHNSLDDLGPLGELRHLVNLKLISAVGNDIDALAEVERLRELDLSENGIDDISPLAGLTDLRKLVLAENDVDDLAPLAGMVRLEELDLEYNHVVDLDPLADMRHMQKLVVWPSGIEDIQALAGMPLLEHLDLAGGRIEDISPLAGLEYLSYVRLFSNDIRDISPLVANPGLDQGDEVVLIDNPLDCQAQADNIQALRDRGVEISTDCD